MEREIKEYGTVKMYCEKRGYGFVDVSGKDYFFHISEIQPAGEIPKFGDSVIVTGYKKNHKGVCAAGIVLV